jgi:protein AroM
VKLGAVTIGQSPREDVVPEIREILGTKVKIIERGALDRLNLEEIRLLSPNQSDELLITRMRDGTEVRVARRHIVPRMKEAVSELVAESIEIVLMLCTEEFSEVRSSAILLHPGRMIRNIVNAVMEEGRLGVVLPSADQIPIMKERWKCCYRDVVIDAVSPYTATETELAEVGMRMRHSQVDLVVFDCIGFNRKAKSIFREILKKPVLLPRTLLGRIAKELLEGLKE